MINESENFGYYVIHKIKDSTDRADVYRDVYLLSNTKNDIQTLKQHDGNQDPICCYQYTGSQNTELKQHFNGFARIITYTDSGLDAEDGAVDID